MRFGQLNFRASVAPSALLKPFSNDDDDDGDGFPVIEFRIINDRANHEGSEIWDAQVRMLEPFFGSMLCSELVISILAKRTAPSRLKL